MQLGWDGVEDTKAKRYAKELCFFLFFFFTLRIGCSSTQPQPGARDPKCFDRYDMAHFSSQKRVDFCLPAEQTTSHFSDWKYLGKYIYTHRYVSIW